MNKTIFYQEFKIGFRQIVEMLFFKSFRNIKHKVELTQEGNQPIEAISKFGYYHSFDLISQRKQQKSTTILEFTVIQPQHELETIGEKLKLSVHGEYCPDKSLRGYQLSELLTKLQYYKPTKILQQDRVINLS